METGERVAPADLARATIATLLIVAAITALAITSLIHSHVRAAADARLMGEPPASEMQAVQVSRDVNDIGPFAFGHLDFEWNPSPPGGVPGFDAWPPNGAQQR